MNTPRSFAAPLLTDRDEAALLARLRLQRRKDRLAEQLRQIDAEADAIDDGLRHLFRGPKGAAIPVIDRGVTYAATLDWRGLQFHEVPEPFPTPPIVADAACDFTLSPEQITEAAFRQAVQDVGGDELARIIHDFRLGPDELTESIAATDLEVA